MNKRGGEEWLDNGLVEVVGDVSRRGLPIAADYEGMGLN